MDIELAVTGKMSSTGSALLNSLQNNNTPVLDLLVRESVQNSLDAAKPDTDYVNFDFSVKDFDSIKFNKHLDKLENKLNSRFHSGNYKGLVISDKNTVGLYGPVSPEEIVKENEYGNFWKLVYDIQKPQDTDGAGGSWGLGKTVYFRVGIGLVVYYSRILKDDYNFQSRLIVTFAENEKSKDSIIPAYPNDIKRGLAWWGKSIGENSIVPITDEDFIQSFLSIFNVEPFNNNDTGTKIIIPYIDEEKLLNSNAKIENKNDRPYWLRDFTSFLKMSIFRWYTPRLNNICYGKPFLKASINGNSLTYNDMPQVFKLFLSLYNKACHKESIPEMDFFVQNGIDLSKNFYIDEITRVKELEKTEQVGVKPVVGFFASIKINKSFLIRHQEFSPYLYLNMDSNVNDEGNQPIILYTRKPGMIVNFAKYKKRELPTDNTDYYIIGIFVAAKNTKFKKEYYKFGAMDKQLTIEEYLRGSELADHRGWQDYTIGKIPNETETPNIIGNIWKCISNNIYDHYHSQKEENDKRFNAMFGELLGSFLLPKFNFGTGPSLPSRHSSKSSGIPRHYSDNTVLKIENELEYKNNTVIIPAFISFVKDSASLSVELKIMDESEGISFREWEANLDLNMPFSIKELGLEKIKIQPNGNDIFVYDDIKFNFIYSLKNICVGFKVVNKLNNKKSVPITIIVEVYNKDYRPILYTKNGQEA